MQLVQKEFMKGSQTFEICDDEIRVKWKYHMQSREYKIPLRIINKNPEIHAVIDIKCLVIFILFSFLAVLCFFCVFILRVKDSDVLIMLAIIPSLIASISFYEYKKRSYNYLIYYNIFSGQSVLAFYRNKPDKNSFSVFIDQLNDKLSKQNINTLSGQEKGISGEILKLHKLLEEGILSEEEYAAGKAKILSTEGDEWKY